MSELLEQFFNLRNAQSNAQSDAERKELQRQIIEIQKKIDAMK